ncbi:MAG: phosphodiester glycosidase family protein [Vicinamibacterales bacterium]
MRGRWRSNLAAVLVLVAAATLGARQPAGDGRGGAWTARPYRGVTVMARTWSMPRPIRAHIAVVDLSTRGIRVSVTPPGGSREVVRETTVGALARAGAQLAVNGHFFLPFPSDDADAWVVGLAASEGRVYSAFESPEQNFAIVADAPALRFDRRQRARIVHRRPGSDGRGVRERGTVWNAVAGSAQIVTAGAVTIPVYRDAAHPDGALVPGPEGRYSNARSWYDVVTARTVAGLSRDRRRLTLFTVDARGGSDGMTLGEVAALLVRDFGVWDALNLDGGGSTSMAWRDPATGAAALLNTSSDSPGGRKVATNLLVFAEPVADGAARAPGLTPVP